MDLPRDALYTFNHPATSPVIGDVWIQEEQICIYNGSEWKPIDQLTDPEEDLTRWIREGKKDELSH